MNVLVHCRKLYFLSGNFTMNIQKFIIVVMLAVPGNLELKQNEIIHFLYGI